MVPPPLVGTPPAADDSRPPAPASPPPSAEYAGPRPGYSTPSGPAARLTGGAPPANPSADALLADASGRDVLPGDLSSGRADPVAARPPDTQMPAVSVTGTGNAADTAMPDAGVPDAGVPDAGVPDASVPDAGVPDDESFDTDFLDRPIPGSHDDGEDGAGEVPEVELSDTEVAEVLSGRVIPIGAFFGGSQSAPARQADDDMADAPGATFLADAGRIAAAWAQERYIGLTSACGICIALTACAAAWFSAGTRADIIRGVAALWGGYLVLRAGQWLALQSGEAETGQQPAAGPDAGTAADNGTGPAAAKSAASAVQGLTTRRGGTGAGLRRAGPVVWLAALGGALAECGVYAGLAVGAAAERWGSVWTLAIAVLSLVAVRNLMKACSTPPGFSDRSDGVIRRLCEAVLTMPVGGRVLLVGVVAPFWGARAALLALLDWAIVSIGYGIAGRAAAGVTTWAGRGGQPAHSAARSKLVRLRDDGALARALGALVRGNLMPLPPAILGLAAVSALALLGLHGLPGALLIAPAVVMLLAAPGSAHPHTGRFDWLVPVLLLGAQCLYLTATGLAVRVPGPVIFALIAAIMLRYTDLAWPGRPVQFARRQDPDAEPAERGTALGWEGRMLFAGLTAAMGVATFAYLALTVYLGLLICAKVVTSCLAPAEQARR